MPWRTLVPILVLLVLGGTFARGELGQGGAQERDGDARSGRVVRVVDGDTIRVRLGDREEAVRLIGVDTPESVKPNTPVECFAKRSSAYTKRLVGGRRVRLELDVEARDRFGRLLAYVRRADDDAFVNAALVREGYATTLTIPPNVRYAERFVALARQARERGRGLWSAC